MQKHLEKTRQITFECIFGQRIGKYIKLIECLLFILIGFLLLKEYCDQLEDGCGSYLKFYDEVIILITTILCYA